jgi:filamentous hemagglutinin family protein
MVSKNMISVVKKRGKKKGSLKQMDNRPKKIDKMVDIIQREDDGRFIIFANYSKTIDNVQNALNKHHISNKILRGSASTIKGTLQKFNDGKLDVIILNASNFGAGLNIQAATDVIIYHRFDRELEEQVIGRAQRYGREGKLNIHYLIHDNELSDFMDTDKFDFNDINDGDIDMGLESESDSDDSESGSDMYSDSDSDSETNSDSDSE